MSLPQIYYILKRQQSLNDIQATAGELWIGFDGKEHDHDGSLYGVVKAHWARKEVHDAYGDFLAKRGTCDNCAETYRFENLSFCPNCFKTYCYRHDRICECGHKTLG